MPRECPVCHTVNPETNVACDRCGAALVTAADATLVLGENTVAIPSGDPDTHGGDQLTIGSEATVESGSWIEARVPEPMDEGALVAVGPGSVLGDRYEIVKLLGEGGMGAVYKARDRELDRLVALKLIRPELASHADILRRFKQELILARQITHRNVIRIYDLALAGGRKFITMEFVEGRDLMAVVRDRGKLPAAEAAGIFRQAIMGLAAAHNEGVVHRDLKPHNIMVDGSGRAYLMDFGIARSLESAGMTRTGVLMGTPDYMSPEQARGERVDARSDLFSMGVILFEMLTGRLPYVAASAMGTLLKRTQEKAPTVSEFAPETPPYLAAIVARCLAIRPEDRYQTAEEILADVETQQVRRTPSGGDAQAATVVIAHRGLKPGAPFGPRYQIDSLLGEGAMGSVYKARDLELDRTVALKLVRPELADRPSMMEKLKSEIALASRISHKHILRIHDLGEVEGTKFISMAYVEGQDLGQLIWAKRRLPIEEALEIAVQICQALDAAHSEGVVHRDLKPQNVLVNRDGQACISDFGLATSVGADAAGEILGTPRYMAPEQVESKAVDHRADIYAFGLILYEMVTGDLPFQSETMMQAMFQRVTQEPRNPKLLNPDLPDALVALILKCLERDPEKRYQSAHEILADLNSIRQAATAPALAETLVTARKNPSRRFLWIGVAAVLVVAAGLTAWLFPQIRGSGANGPTQYLAVIPFRVVGDDPALGLAADGLFDSLNSRLSQLKSVHLPPSSAESRVNASEPLQKVARALGSKLVFYGSVYGENGKLRMIVSLNDPGNDKRLWTQEFTGVPQDQLALQNQIYNALIAKLGVKLSSEEMARGIAGTTEDISAYTLYLKGRGLMRGKRDEKTLDAALDNFDAAAKQDPNFALAFTGAADASTALYSQTKNSMWTSRALGAANRAQQLNDSLPEVHYALGSVYAATGRTTEAISELKRALELAPNSDEAWRRIGRIYMNSGQQQKAIDAYEKAIAANPYYWLNQNLLGIAYYNTAAYDKALNAFQQVATLDPSRPEGWSNMGNYYYRVGDWNQARAMYKKAIELGSADAISNIAVVDYLAGDCTAARADAEKAVAAQPNDAVNLANLAAADRCLGQQDKANALYKQAIASGLATLQVNPKDADTTSTLATYYALTGDRNRAQQFIQRALAIDPQNADVEYRAAAVDVLTGNKDLALDRLKKALAAGYSAKEAAADPDMSDLKRDPRFQTLVRNSAK